MGLSERDRQRYARHLLLTQVGEAGQERLLAAKLRVHADADRGVLEVARTYLERAGLSLTVRDAGSEPDSLHTAQADELRLPSSEDVARVAGGVELAEAARALLGALAAVSAIQRAVEARAGVVAQAPSPTPPLSFAISSEDA